MSASDKFDTIRWLINKDKEHDDYYTDSEGYRVFLAEHPERWIGIFKSKLGKNNEPIDSTFSVYCLNKSDNWRFTLRAGPRNNMKTTENLTETDVMNEVFPNFERRIKERNAYIEMEKQNAIKNAAKYAKTDQIQSWLEADALINEFLA